MQSKLPLVLLLLCSTAVQAQKSETPKEHKIAPAPFRKVITVDAWLTPADATAVSVDPGLWKTLSLIDLVPHGTRVEAGDRIAAFDVEALEKRIEELERGQDSNADSLKRLEAEVEAFRKTHPMDLADAIRKDEQTAEHLAYWKETGRALAVQAAERELVNAEQALYYAKEELKQLRKMYEADNLTEETEEIILKRSVWAVERGEIALERTRLSTKRELEVLIPRRDKSYADAATRAAIARAKTEAEHAAQLAQKEFELAEKRRSNAEATEDLEKLRRDLEILREVKAPAAGRVLWGDWTDLRGPFRLADFERKYTANPKGAVQPRDVFATIAEGVPNTLVGRLAQADRHAIGWRGSEPEDAKRYATLEAHPSFAFSVTLGQVDATPDPSGMFGITLGLDTESLADDDLPPVTPGMKTRVVLLDYANDAALAAPAAFIRSRFDGTRMIHEARVSSGGDEPEISTREVRTGHRNDGMIEILDGLKAGEILVPHS